MQEFKLKVMDRKDVVKRMEQLLGIRSKFMRGQDYSYQIGAYTITRDGILIAPDEAFEEILQTLVMEDLIERVQSEETIAVTEAIAEIVPEPEESMNATDDTAEDVSDILENIEPVLTLPLTDHTGLTLRNLVHLFYTRASLIEKSTGAHFYVSDAAIKALQDDICTYSLGNFIKVISENCAEFQGVIFTNDSIFITAAPKNTDEEHMRAFCDLITLMDQSAIAHKRIFAKKINEDNEKFAMRIWLDGIGLKGAEYRQSRRILMKPLHGISAFRTQEQLDIAVEKFRRERMCDENHHARQLRS